MKRFDIDCTVEEIHDLCESEDGDYVLYSDVAQLQAELARTKAALAEISLGMGAFSRDPLEHAENCIENMKEIARNALAGEQE